MTDHLQKIKAEMEAWNRIAGVHKPSWPYCQAIKALMEEHGKKRVKNHARWICAILDEAEERAKHGH